MTREQTKKLKKILGAPCDGIRIGYEDGAWCLAEGSGMSFEIIVQHEDFDEFLKLVFDTFPEEN